MKKLFTSLVAALFAFTAFAAPFGITVNGTPVIGTENPSPMDPSFQEWRVLGQSLQTGDVIQLYDQDNGKGVSSTWIVNLSSEIKVSITVEGDHYVMGEDGEFDFYIKLKQDADELWVQKSGDEPTPGGTGFGIKIDGTTPVIGQENPTPMEGFQEYMVLNQSLTAGQTVALYDASTGSTWAVPLDPASVAGIEQVDNLSYAVTADGCYDFYIKIKSNEDQLYVGAGKDCGDTPGPGPTPGPTPTPGDNAWYIYGYIGGVDYTGEDYPFKNGVADISSLTTEPATTSYVYVHEYNSGVNYMTNGWAGEVRSVIMDDESTIEPLERNKLMLPFGATNLYLAENADGSVTVSLDPITEADEAFGSTETTEYKYYDENYNVIIVKNGVKRNLLGVIID